MIYIYGIDLAEALNYYSVWINGIYGRHVRIATIRKGKDALYPELEQLMVKTLFPRFPPKEIWIDFTNEKSFSEWLECHFHPAFKNPHSPHYKKWKIVVPYVMNQPNKLIMKQNARQMMEPDDRGFQIFEWPNLAKTHPLIAKYVTEAQEQLLREAGITSNATGGVSRMKFPKPVGFDNDMAIACELSLMGCRKYLGYFGGQSGAPSIHGGKMPGPVEKTDPKKEIEKKIKERVSSFNVTDIDITLS